MLENCLFKSWNFSFYSQKDDNVGASPAYRPDTSDSEPGDPQFTYQVPTVTNCIIRLLILFFIYLLTSIILSFQERYG